MKISSSVKEEGVCDHDIASDVFYLACRLDDKHGSLRILSFIPACEGCKYLSGRAECTPKKSCNTGIYLALGGYTLIKCSKMSKN